MQRTPFVNGEPAERLVERVRGNRLLVEDTALRLTVTRAAVEERRSETERLLDEVRRALITLREHRAGLRAVDELTAEKSDSPSMGALAERCAMSVERVLEALELRVAQRALSIDVPIGAASDDPVIELGQEDLGFRQLENRQLLANLLDR